jgi:hypothetical protein
MNRYNFKMYNFDDFIVIQREKLGTRQLHQIYTKFLLDKYKLDLRPDHLDFNGTRYDIGTLNNYWLDINIDEVPTPLKAYQNKFPTREMLLDTVDTKLEKIEINKLYDVLVEYREKNTKIIETVWKRQFDKPIIFLYKSPLRLVLTSLIQDVDTLDIDEATNIPAELNSFFKEKLELSENIKEYSFYALDMIKQVYKNQSNILPNNIRQYFYDYLIEKIIEEMDNSSIGAHRGWWLSLMFPIIEGNPNVKLVNLDSGDVDFQKLFSDMSNHPVDYFNGNEYMQSNKKDDSNLEIIKGIYKRVLNSDIRKKIEIAYGSEFFIYRYIISDIRNLYDPNISEWNPFK